MLYNTLKILHILSATFLVTSMTYSCLHWLFTKELSQKNVLADKIQMQTCTIVIPFAILQLATGFTMISIKQYPVSQFWIAGSISCFILLIASWFAFLYLLMTDFQHSKYSRFYEKLQKILLSTTACSVLFMVFLMANRIL